MRMVFDSWQAWALLAAVFAALTAVFAKLGVTNVDSNVATLARTLVIVFVLGLVLLANGRLGELGRFDGRTWLFLILSGLATGASWLAYFRALQLGEASRVAPLDKLSVVFVAVLAALFLGEKLSLIGWTGIGLITLGAILVALA